MHQFKTYGIGLLVFASVASCGGLKPSDKVATSDADAELDDTSAESSSTVSLELKADYKEKPVDFVLLRENSDRIQNNGGTFKLFSNNANEVDLAYTALATRLLNAGVDIRVGIVNAVNGNAATRGHLVVGAAEQPNFMVPTGFEFINAAYTRFRTANVDGDWRNLRPYAAIRGLIESSATAGNPSSSFIRKNALLSILYVGYMDEGAEAIDFGEMKTYLDEKKGANGWIVSAIAPPKGGCSFRINETDFNTNMDASAAASNDAAVYTKHVRYEKMIKLQAASGGLFQSICSTSHSDFIAKLGAEGIKQAFFDVKLKVKPDPKTFEIRVAKTSIKDWKYNTETQVLSLPTTIKPGTKLTITYESIEKPEGEIIKSSSEETEKIGKIGETKLSPAEAAYISDGVSDAMATCRGCHNGRLNTFAGVFALKDAIRGRLMNGTMPPNDPNFGASPQGITIINWTNEY